MRKSIFRRCAAAFLSIVMALSITCVTAFAEDTYKNGWSVTFTGSSMESNFSAMDIYAAMCSLLPGDMVEIRIDVINSSESYTQWYISNDTLQTLEDARVAAKNGGYGYYLSYTSPNGSAVLFESDTVGGDGVTLEGLYGATDNLDEFMKLCTMAPGGSGYVTLRVGLDGETQGNGYQDTLAKLRIVFAVDTVPTKYVEVPGDPTIITVTDPPTRIEIPGDPVYVIREEDTPLSDLPRYTTVPQTSDTIKAAVWSAAAMIAGVGCAAFVIIKKKKDNESEKGGAVR